MKGKMRSQIGLVLAVIGLCFAAAWKEQNPDRPAPNYMEAYEVSEYGRAPTEEDFNILLG